MVFSINPESKPLNTGFVQINLSVSYKFNNYKRREDQMDFTY